MESSWRKRVVRYVEGGILGVLIVDHEWTLVALWSAALLLELVGDFIPQASVEKWHDRGARMRDWLLVRRTGRRG